MPVISHYETSTASQPLLKSPPGAVEGKSEGWPMCWQLPRCAGQVTHVSIEQSAAGSDEQCGPTFEHT